mmetsp:Transcript_31520/g.93982  ORF Transcript_31520/g.93982 Transcript_31520/m.93982 type:complete len:318 (-) Transcript_31520:642-1595(-)
MLVAAPCCASAAAGGREAAGGGARRSSLRRLVASSSSTAATSSASVAREKLDDAGMGALRRRSRPGSSGSSSPPVRRPSDAAARVARALRCLSWMARSLVLNACRSRASSAERRRVRSSALRCSSEKSAALATLATKLAAKLPPVATNTVLSARVCATLRPPCTAPASASTSANPLEPPAAAAGALLGGVGKPGGGAGCDPSGLTASGAPSRRFFMSTRKAAWRGGRTNLRTASANDSPTSAYDAAHMLASLVGSVTPKSGSDRRSSAPASYMRSLSQPASAVMATPRYSISPARLLSTMVAASSPALSPLVGLFAV